MGTARRFTYLPRPVQDALSGSIVNVALDATASAGGIVKYEFHDETFSECDLSLLLSILLYSSIQGSTKQLRLLDLEIPEAMWSSFPGPRFGREGLRSIAGEAGRPLFGVILKPRQGLTPALAATIAAAATRGGADYVIDDEVLVNHPRCPLIERTKHIIASCETEAKKRGRPILYVVNVISRSQRIHKWIAELVTLDRQEVHLGIMVNGLVMGFETVAEIRESMPEWPLIATTVASGMLVLAPHYNVSEHILAQFARFAGADAVYSIRHITEYEYDASKIDTLQRHLWQHDELMRPSLPIYAGAISLGSILRDQLPAHPDFMVQAGSTICGYTQAGHEFPETIVTATRAMVDALSSAYIDGVQGQLLAEKLVRENNRRGRGLDLNMLGMNP